METTELKLYALLRDKKDGSEYEVCLRIQEEKVNVKNEFSIKDDISSLRREIMNTQSALKSAIYFTATVQLFLIALFFLFTAIVLISK